jgi:hypothetical protein
MCRLSENHAFVWPGSNDEGGAVAAITTPAPSTRYRTAYDFFSFHTASGANTRTKPSDHSNAGAR